MCRYIIDNAVINPFLISNDLINNLKIKTSITARNIPAAREWVTPL